MYKSTSLVWKKASVLFFDQIKLRRNVISSAFCSQGCCSARAAAREWLRLQWARRHRPDRSLQRDREPAIAIPCRTYRYNRRSIPCNRCLASADSASNPPGVSAGRLWKGRVWRVERGFERSPWREEWGNGEIRVRVCGGWSKERLIRTPFPRKRGASGNRRRSRS